MSLGGFILKREGQSQLYTGSIGAGPAKVKYINQYSYIEYNMTSCSNPNTTNLWIIIPLTGAVTHGYPTSSTLNLEVSILSKKLSAIITETKVKSDAAPRLLNLDKPVHQPNAPNAPNDPYAYQYHRGGSRKNPHKIPKVHIGPLGGPTRN